MCFFSIICVSKNSKKLVEQTINSIIMQSFTNYEIIFIDNLSSDGTVEKIKELCKEKKINNYKLISEVDEGIADAMNKGGRISKGKILNFLHFGDAYANQNVLDIASRKYKNNKFQIFSGAAIYNYGTPKAYTSYPKTIEKIYYANTFPHMSVFIDTDVFKLVGGYNKKLKIVMDYDFWFRAYLLKVKFEYTKDIFTNLAPAGLSGNISKVLKEFYNCKRFHIKEVFSLYQKVKIATSLLIIFLKVLMYVFKK